MLNSETKRKIQAARDVLVGKIPVPSQQVEQITLAMIYKFMSDMDTQAEELGDHTGFFKDEFEKYNWTYIMDISLSAYDRVVLYSEGLEKMGTNPNVPQLFRDMFKGAYLPFRDPELLKLFLQQINGLTYEHSEDLGDAFEFLLSVLGSQGDAGQFRTPRHIIDFIVDVVDPLKTDRILDPACGTAGFLISAYKHILKHNTLPNGRSGSALSSDEKTRLTSNVNGYDISTDMRRLSLVNLYLHQFPDPKVYEYDTLGSLDRWDEEFDCILANPPFMTPKGGVMPHNRFAVKANKSEVLFVDYIMEHLSTTGKAGIVVPEGIIFQSGNAAYKQLRRLLVDEGYLWAVISLPSGVFNPYAGVKTSILMLDKNIAKKTKSIMFVKVSDDGFDLGAQRREKGIGELPMATEALKAYKKYILEGGEVDITGWPSNLKEVETNPLCQFALKLDISKSGDYNLSQGRYSVTTDLVDTKFPIVSLGETIHLDFGERITKSKNLGTKYPVYGGGGESFRTDKFNRENEYVIARFAMSEHCVRFVSGQFWMMDSGGTFSVRSEFQAKLDKSFVGKVLLNRQPDIFRCARGGAQKNLDNDHFYELKFPLPPLSVQQELVAELDRYQRIIDGAQAVIDNWKPEIETDPEWEKVKLGEVCVKITDGSHNPPREKSGGGNFMLSSQNVFDGYITTDKAREIEEADFKSEDRRTSVKVGDVLLTIVGTIGRTAVVTDSLPYRITLQRSVAVLKTKVERLIPEFLSFMLRTDELRSELINKSAGVAQKGIYLKQLGGIEIPLPQLAIQKQIVDKIEAERALVASSKILISIYVIKMKEIVDKLWKE